MMNKFKSYDEYRANKGETPYERLDEKVEQELDETGDAVDLILDAIGIGYKEFKKTKMKVYMKGLLMGAVSAVAIQSIITILVLIK